MSERRTGEEPEMTDCSQDAGVRDEHDDPAGRDDDPLSGDGGQDLALLRPGAITSQGGLQN